MKHKKQDAHYIDLHCEFKEEIKCSNIFDGIKKYGDILPLGTLFLNINNKTFVT